MRSSVGSGFRLRNPAYTGENRCLPCTVVNVAIAAVLAAAFGFVTTAGAGIVLFLGCAAMIVCRGYLIPGTPTLTKRYLPVSIRRLFGKDDASDRTVVDQVEDGWRALESAGVAIETDAGSIHLADEFQERWMDELHTSQNVSPTCEAVAGAIGVDDVTRQGPRSFSVDGARLLEWDSEAALVADVAASTVLESWVRNWDDLDLETRRTLYRRLRLLLERCPACDGSVERRRERVDPCCQPARVFVWAQCGACDALLAEEGVPARNADELNVFDDVLEQPTAE